MKLKYQIEKWPLAQKFSISRGSITEVTVLVVEIEQEGLCGRGEGRPYARYKETPESVEAQILHVKKKLEDSFTSLQVARTLLQKLLPAGSARNAIDCALWDLETKQSQKPIHELLKLVKPQALLTAYTISVDTPEKMAVATKKAAKFPLLKVKLTGTGDLERVKAVREAAPESRLIVDANEAWQANDCASMMFELKNLEVELIEQPLPENQDDLLKEIPHPIPLCADESFHDSHSLKNLIGKYEYVNLKLDKTGGLTEALQATELAQKLGFKLMVGCMISTSLSIAPAFLIAQKAELADLDAPLWLVKDRPYGLRAQDSILYPPERSLWG